MSRRPDNTLNGTGRPEFGFPFGALGFFHVFRAGRRPPDWRER